VADHVAAPVRMVHLGLGGFSRAHQLWYTDRAPDAREWGVAGFTGRSPALARALAPQDGLYTLVTRGAAGSSYDVVGSLSRVQAASDHRAWREVIASPALAVLTLTITEAGYCRDANGDLDLERADVRADVAALRADPAAAVTTAPAKVVAGLLARRAAGSGAMTVVPCDNLLHNGPVAARVVGQLAEAVDPAFAPWLRANVSFATTMVDRITPRTTDADRREVLQATGFRDEAPVVTEPFTEWVVRGAFPGGRPRWEDAGVRLVDDVEPYEQRKLWLLNGAHSILALGGGLRGHTTVAEAVADPVCRTWIQQWWAEAMPHLTSPQDELAAYTRALVTRFANPAIEHRLAQIATDSAQKLPVRVLPVLRDERADGHLPPAAVGVLAAWVLHLRGKGVPVDDPLAEALTRTAMAPLGTTVVAGLALLGDDLARDRGLVDAVTNAALRLAA